MPPLPWRTRHEYLMRDDSGKTYVLTVKGPEDEAQLKQQFFGAFTQRDHEVHEALKANNLDAAVHAEIGRMALFAELLQLQETGDNSIAEVDGAWEAGHALCEIRRRFPVNTFDVKVDPGPLTERCQRVRVLVEYRDALDSLRTLAHQSLAAELAQMEPQLRSAHQSLGPTLATNWTLRRTAKALIDYVTGAAKLAAERARQNKRLVENTRNSVLSLFQKGKEGKELAPEAPTPAPTPPAPPAVKPPQRSLIND